jgi:hypothetical protein
MKQLALALMLVLLVASASALQFSQSSYIVVVGKDAPATDVIIAANFAASMKGFTGITFESAIDEEAYNNLPDFAGRTIVVIDGAQKQVRITPTTTGDAASAYFRQQGFEVVNLQSRRDLLVKPPQEEEKEIAVALTPPAEVTPIPVTAKIEEEMKTTEDEPTSPPPAEPQAPEPEKPSVATRIWHWFASWF